MTRRLLTAGLLSLVLILPASLSACPHYPTRWSRRRGCQSRIKTLAGAIEMYNLDKNRTETELTPALLDTLVDDGYLVQAFRCHVREREGLAGPDYALAGAGAEVVCLTHGAIQPPPGTDRDNAREQLRALGITDPTLLARASTEVPEEPSLKRTARRWPSLAGLASAFMGLPGLLLLLALG